tara:strand:- start:391 stop:1065 length:675 start_codon:yes stop_codon:yes gene_type:complete
MVHKIIQSKYRIFIETLLLTLLILVIGFLIGIQVEQYRTNKIISNYKIFEVDALDLKLQNFYYQIMGKSSCNIAVEQNFIFADKIYNQGLILEKYEEANELSKDILLEKKRYVLLKTELWLNSILLREKCEGAFDTVVYIYSQNEGGEMGKKAEQDAVSNVLRSIKEERGNEIILIPIAGDLGLDSVELQMQVHKIDYLPSVIINELHILEGFKNKEEVELYLE